MKRIVIALVLTLCACAALRVPPTNPYAGQVVSADEKKVVVRGYDATYPFVLDDPLVTVEHLLIHKNQQWVVIVTFHREGGSLVATKVSDGPR